ncbi:MAG: tRNA (adenosine(37)-N6)-threonylcarbamoyltransferase complex ATPase subunit type 1 TsaE [Rhizobiales bacterium]|nr:tRNA (adenosine(37)-N6)-threonylcarbamoyltransferase complex ATPase subunit type 1 TsaE [Hyphomicrobiales bacterium]
MGSGETGRETWRLDGVDETGVARLAELVALLARVGDLILLEGELGAGKTTFARWLVRAAVGDRSLDVASPSFPLVLGYSAARFQIDHFDLYRLENADARALAETGLEDALGRGLVLIEWPERAAHMLAGHEPTLTVRLVATPDGENLRSVMFVAGAGWRARLERARLVHGFLARHGYGGHRIDYLQGDASPRGYGRLSVDGASVILMNAPRQPDGPPLAGGRTYSAIAHLAEDVRPFVAIAMELRRQGVAAPEILAGDLDAGLLVIEDFGDRVLGREIAAGADIAALYRPAVELLARLAGVRAPARITFAGEAMGSDGPVEVVIPDYDEGALLAEVDLLCEWYWRLVTGAPAPVDKREEFSAIWRRALRPVLGGESWVLRDYHSPNLVLLDDRRGAPRIGVLDFQDALRGSPAYDLVSLTQDARLDVPGDVEEMLLQDYRRERLRLGHDFDWEEFRRQHAILGAQRATKILGIFARLALRDAKPQYLAHLPRIWRYLLRNLGCSRLGELSTWYDRELAVAARGTGNITQTDPAANYGGLPPGPSTRGGE